MTSPSRRSTTRPLTGSCRWRVNHVSRKQRMTGSGMTCPKTASTWARVLWATTAPVPRSRTPSNARVCYYYDIYLFMYLFYLFNRHLLSQRRQGGVRVPTSNQEDRYSRPCYHDVLTYSHRPRLSCHQVVAQQQYFQLYHSCRWPTVTVYYLIITRPIELCVFCHSPLRVKLDAAGFHCVWLSLFYLCCVKLNCASSCGDPW